MSPLSVWTTWGVELSRALARVIPFTFAVSNASEGSFACSHSAAHNSL